MRGSKVGHIGKLAVAAFPRTSGVGNGPTVVDDHERPIPAGGRQVRHQIGIALNVLGRAVPAVGVIPVVAAVNRRRRETRLARKARGRSGAPIRTDSRLCCHAASRTVAASRVRSPSRTAPPPLRRSIHKEMPTGSTCQNAKARAAGRYAIPVSSPAVECQEVPWENALAEDAAPFQVAVTPFPMIVQDAPPFGHIRLPAEANPHHRSFRRFHPDRQAGAARLGFHRDTARRPSPAVAARATRCRSPGMPLPGPANAGYRHIRRSGQSEPLPRRECPLTGQSGYGGRICSCAQTHSRNCGDVGSAARS